MKDIKYFCIERTPNDYGRSSNTLIFERYTGKIFFKIEHYYSSSTISSDTSMINIDIHNKKYNPVKQLILSNLSIWRDGVTYDFQKEIGHLIQSIDREDKLNQLLK